jgi:phospholipid/cholesterol/gamma-HCH transport system ATP-binding protein
MGALLALATTGVKRTADGSRRNRTVKGRSDGGGTVLFLRHFRGRPAPVGRPLHGVATESGFADDLRYRPVVPVGREDVPSDHIVVEKVSKRYGDFYALRDVDLRVARGHVAVIIGGSGAGKTTLLKILIGLDKPTSGNVHIAGTNIIGLGDRAMAAVRKKISMVFQYSALLDSMNVLENVAFPLREHTKHGDKEIKKRVIEKLKILELENVEYKFPSQLSGGMRKRVGLARALMLEPEIIMYDEPTSGLDPITSRLVDDLILTTRNRFHVTSVVISHDMAGALRIADYIYLMDQGSLVVSGSPREIVESKHELVREFLDSSGIDANQILAEHAEHEK